jgi:hypothetical protein
MDIIPEVVIYEQIHNAVMVHILCAIHGGVFGRAVGPQCRKERQARQTMSDCKNWDAVAKTCPVTGMDECSE